MQGKEKKEREKSLHTRHEKKNRKNGNRKKKHRKMSNQSSNDPHRTACVEFLDSMFFGTRLMFLVNISMFIYSLSTDFTIVILDNAIAFAPVVYLGQCVYF